MHRLQFVSFCLLSLLAVFFVTGCSASFDPCLSSPLAEPSSVGLSASLFGGRQPISSAHVYMYAADSTAYGHASDSLLLAYSGGSYPTTEDANGNYYITTSTVGAFNISAGEYACTTGSEVYLYAIGGNPGLGENTAAGLLAVLGQCQSNGSFPGVTFVTINEVSTIAAAYAMAGYAVDATHVATSGTTLAKTGISNAFANAANLYNISAGGVAPTTTPNGNGTVPQTLINSLANSLAGCINSTGPSSGACGLVLGNAKSVGSTGTTPTDTATAAINIAHYPGNAVAAILSAAPSISAPYQPVLGATPNDLTVGISFTGGGIANPQDIAVDGSGNVWITNPGANGVTKLSPLGVASTGSPFSARDASFVAIDTSNQAWITSESGNEIFAFTSAGGTVSGSPFAPSVYIVLSGTYTLESPQGIAIDVDGDILVASEANAELFKLNASGANLAGPYNSTCMTSFSSLAIDTSDNVWSTSPTVACEIGPIDLGLSVGTVRSSTSGLSGAERTAIDGTGNVWVTDHTSSEVTQYSSTANQNSGSPFSGGGLSSPMGIAIDGLGYAWVANAGNSSVSRFSGAGVAESPSTGYTGGSQSGSQNIAVDGSGDVWITNTTGNSVTELIGAGAPVITPLTAGVQEGKLGTRP